MTSINIIGTGNLAWHIASALKDAPNYELNAIVARSENACHDFKQLANSCVSIEDLTPAGLTLIAVSDDAIVTLTKKIPYTSGLFVHTSGCVSIDVLSKFAHSGVFYPLQSFSKGDPIDFKDIPICIEAEDEDDLNVLEKLGLALSQKVNRISSEERKKLHLAAVFINNFTNHCFTIGQDLCHTHSLSFDLLKPLLAKTAEKALHADPSKMQTGPAKRNDIKTMNQHLDQLEDSLQKEVYLTLSKAITTYYGKKL